MISFLATERMAPSEKTAIFELPFELLAGALKLPPGVRVVECHVDGKSASLLIRVEGNGLPDKCAAPDGSAYVRVDPWYRWTECTTADDPPRKEKLVEFDGFHC